MTDVLSTFPKNVLLLSELDCGGQMYNWLKCGGEHNNNKTKNVHWCIVHINKFQGLFNIYSWPKLWQVSSRHWPVSRTFQEKILFEKRVLSYLSLHNLTLSKMLVVTYILIDIHYSTWKCHSLLDNDVRNIKMSYFDLHIYSFKMWVLQQNFGYALVS